MIGSAEGFAGIVEWQPDDYYLVVLAPILDIPEEMKHQPEFYRMLLELNYHGTLSTHFSIYEDTLILALHVLFVHWMKRRWMMLFAP